MAGDADPLELPEDAWPPMIHTGAVVPDPNEYEGRRIIARRVRRESTGRIVVLGEYQRGGKPDYIVFTIPRLGAVCTTPVWSAANWEFEKP